VAIPPLMLPLLKYKDVEEQSQGQTTGLTEEKDENVIKLFIITCLSTEINSVVS